jgi:hypothetical protein
MGGSDKKSPWSIGFLSVIEHEQQGLVGGYLILNATGRPLEFHCTAPVKPSRAQQILYGPTLGPYLYGEQIGQTLLAKGASRPLAVCTDVALAMSVRPFSPAPVALVLARVTPVEPASTPLDGPPVVAADKPIWRRDVGHAFGEHVNTFHLGRNHLAVSTESPDDRAALEQLLGPLGEFDLSEPFERIREAIAEAHKVGRS